MNEKMADKVWKWKFSVLTAKNIHLTLLFEALKLKLCLVIEFGWKDWGFSAYFAGKSMRRPSTDQFCLHFYWHTETVRMSKIQHFD